MDFLRYSLIMALSPAAVLASVIYSVVDLGPAGPGGTAYSISNSGYVAGWVVDALGAPHATLFGAQESRRLSLPPGAAGGIATAVTEDGSIAGAMYSGGFARAVLCRQGTCSSIDGLGGGDSYATAMNSRGQIAGGATTANGQGHAFRYDNRVVRDIGTLPGGSWSSAYAVNQSGTVAGTSETGSGDFRGFVWDEHRGMQAIGTLGGRHSYAMAINGHGQVAGHSTSVSGYLEAYMYAEGALHRLGTLGGSQSFAYGINSRGEVVGYSWTGGDRTTSAFLYRQGMLWDLNGLLDGVNGWTLSEAYGINDAGQIVGAGLVDGQRRAFLLEPHRNDELVANPEPSTIALMAGGLALVAISRIRVNARLKPPPDGR